MLKALFRPDVPFDSLYIPWIYREIYFERIYDKVLDGSRRDLTIVDVGANIGIVTQYMMDYANKVYSIEPTSQHFEALKQNKEFNGWNKVELFNMAIADKNGTMNINLDPNNRTCCSLVVGGATGRETVKTQTLETFMAENNIDVIDFMKFDTEGGEDLIFPSAGFLNVAPRIKSILVEFHFPSHVNHVKNLESIGYKATHIPSSAIVYLFQR